jgi:anti-anti-sigma factor
MLPRLEVRQERDGPRLVLAVRGEIDLATVGGLQDALRRAAEADSDVWVDLCEVEFMDSTGLTALVACQRAIDGRLTVVCPPGGPVRRTLEVSGLHEILHVVGSRAAA